MRLDQTYPNDPVVILLGSTDAAADERKKLGLVCRYFGFQLKEAFVSGEASPVPSPILVVIAGSTLAAATPEIQAALLDYAKSLGAPIAVVGIDQNLPAGALESLIGGVSLVTTTVGSNAHFVAASELPSETGYELRGLKFPLGVATLLKIEASSQSNLHVLANIATDNQPDCPAIAKVGPAAARRYLVSRVCEPPEAASAPGAYPPARFGAIAPFFLLVRDVGGERCWLPPCALANLTIDDPYLTEPYGSLSYPGLLAEMRREPFHATIGFIPWNYDRNQPAVVDLVRRNPEHFSVAVHGNNHDRYEFFRYETRPGDNQRAKPLAMQTFNVGQALARLDAMHRQTGLPFDRVMVFPHGICPADTLGALKHAGYWATFNYDNVPLGETPAVDPARVARAVNSDWHGFPAVRRAYPDKYPDVAIAIDLFLGNPVLFMAHQDNFFGGIAAFTPHAQRVNSRQPAVRWTSLGEISRRLHLQRWLDTDTCEIQMTTRHARVSNHRSISADFFFTKKEPEPNLVNGVTVDGVSLEWSADDGLVRFSTTLGPRSEALVEVHYQVPGQDSPIPLRRSGLRRRLLRLIADFRDLHLPSSSIGRLVTRRYYRSGKKRLTFGALLMRMRSIVRSRQS